MRCFATWKTRAGRTAPTATNDELISVMRAMKSFATTMQEPVQFMDAAVWLLCSKSGLHLTNDELCELWK